MHLASDEATKTPPLCCPMPPCHNALRRKSPCARQCGETIDGHVDEGQNAFVLDARLVVTFGLPDMPLQPERLQHLLPCDGVFAQRYGGVLHLEAETCQYVQRRGAPLCSAAGRGSVVERVLLELRGVALAYGQLQWGKLELPNELPQLAEHDRALALNHLEHQLRAGAEVQQQVLG